MKINIEKMRLEISVRNGVTATIMFDYFGKEFTVHETYNLSMKDIDTIKNICSNNGTALINKDHKKLSKIAKFKVENSSKTDLKIVDRLSPDDDMFFTAGSNNNVTTIDGSYTFANGNNNISIGYNNNPTTSINNPGQSNP